VEISNLADRNTIVGIDFLAIGGTVAALGYVLNQSTPDEALGFSIAVIGALVLLIVPEVVPHDVYRALLKDSMSNVEMILEEAQLKKRAYFIPVKSEDSTTEEIRAFIPIQLANAAGPKRIGGAGATGASQLNMSTLVDYVENAPRRFITDYRDLQGLLVVPPGSDLIKLSKLEEGGELEDALKTLLVDFSDLASSVLLVEEEREGGGEDQAPDPKPTMQSNHVKMQIKGPRLSSSSPFFNECLGTPVSCVACCVAAAVTHSPVRIVEEKYDPSLIRLTIEIMPNNPSH
jgi:hypothetical protein